MTRWKAQAIATVAWFAGALGLTFAMPDSQGGWVTLPNFPILFLFLFGPIAVVVTLATTALVAVWRTIPVRTLVGVHVALGDLFLIWLAAKVNGH